MELDSLVERMDQQEFERSLAAMRISDRDRLLGRCEAIIEMLLTYVPTESPALRNAAETLLGDIKDVYDPGDVE